MLPGVSTLGEPLTRALGPRTAKALEAAFGMSTVGDLLRHYPRRYYTRGELTDLSSLREGDHVTVLARVEHVGLHQMYGKGPNAGRAEVVITDDRAKLVLTFFFRNRGGQYIIKPLVPGMVGMFAGTVSRFRTRLQLVHPEYEMLPGAPPNADLTPELAAEFAAEMIPVYPASAKASSWMIARAVKTVLDPLDAGEDPLPAELRERHGLVGRAEAIRAIHRPLDQADLKRARERLKWDEAFLLQAALAQRRLAAAAMPAMPRPHVNGGIADEFDARLPFTLTAGQVAVGETIAGELACAVGASGAGRRALGAGGGDPFLQPGHHLVEAEAGRLLSLREFDQRLQHLGDVGPRRDQQEGVVEKPVVVGVRRDVGPLMRVGPQVEDLRNPQLGERLGPICRVPGQRCSRNTVR